MGLGLAQRGAEEASGHLTAHASAHGEGIKGMGAGSSQPSLVGG